MRGSACQTLVKTTGRFILCRRPQTCDCAYVHKENYAVCALQFACCGLRHTLPQDAAQAAARKLQRAGRMGFYVCVRAIAVMFINTKHASEIAENSVALLVEIQEKIEINMFNSVRPAAWGKV